MEDISLPKKAVVILVSSTPNVISPTAQPPDLQLLPLFFSAHKNLGAKCEWAVLFSCSLPERNRDTRLQQ